MVAVRVCVRYPRLGAKRNIGDKREGVKREYFAENQLIEVLLLSSLYYIVQINIVG